GWRPDGSICCSSRARRSGCAACRASCRRGAAPTPSCPPSRRSAISGGYRTELACRARSSVACGNRELLERAQAGSALPPDMRRIDREAQLRPSREQCLQCTDRFHARELVAETEMDSSPERQMPVRPPLELEPFRMLAGLPI